MRGRALGATLGCLMTVTYLAVGSAVAMGTEDLTVEDAFEMDLEELMTVSVATVHPPDRRVEPREGVLGDAGRDLAAEAAGALGLVHNQGAVGLAHRGDHGLLVERHQGAEIDYLGFDALDRQLLGHLERRPDSRSVGHKSEVRAFAPDGRASQLRHLSGPRQHRLDAAVEKLVLAVDHRIGVADRRLQQALGVLGGGRAYHLEPGHMGEPGLRVLGVERAGPQERRAGGDTQGAALGDRGVEHPLRPTLMKTAGDAEGALESADVLPQDDDLVVALHLFEQRPLDPLDVGRFA